MLPPGRMVALHTPADAEGNVGPRPASPGIVAAIVKWNKWKAAVQHKKAGDPNFVPHVGQCTQGSYKPNIPATLKYTSASVKSIHCNKLVPWRGLNAEDHNWGLLGSCSQTDHAEAVRKTNAERMRASLPTVRSVKAAKPEARIWRHAAAGIRLHDWKPCRGGLTFVCAACGYGPFRIQQR